MFAYHYGHWDVFDDLLRANADYTLEADSASDSDSGDSEKNCRSCSDSAQNHNLLNAIYWTLTTFPEKNISVSKLVPKPASVIVCDLNQPPRQKKGGGAGRNARAKK